MNFFFCKTFHNLNFQSQVDFVSIGFNYNCQKDVHILKINRIDCHSISTIRLYYSINEETEIGSAAYHHLSAILLNLKNLKKTWFIRETEKNWKGSCCIDCIV